MCNPGFNYRFVKRFGACVSRASTILESVRSGHMQTWGGIGALGVTFYIDAVNVPIVTRACNTAINDLSAQNNTWHFFKLWAWGNQEYCETYYSKHRHKTDNIKQYNPRQRTCQNEDRFHWLPHFNTRLEKVIVFAFTLGWYFKMNILKWKWIDNPNGATCNGFKNVKL